MNKIERFRVTFTANGKRKFVPRDHVFPLPVVYCSLHLLIVSREFYPQELLWTVFICSFSILRISHLESDVCRVREKMWIL